MKQNKDLWQRILAAFKAVRKHHAPGAENLAAPTGFATRVAARASAARRERTLALWRRWSLRTAVGSTCLFLVAVIYVTATRDPGTILPVPSFDLPSP